MSPLPTKYGSSLISDAAPGAGKTAAGRRGADPLTSGSEGHPKGVVHSHKSILAMSSRLKRLPTSPPTIALCRLTAVSLLWADGRPVYATAYRAEVFLYPSPLHYRIVPELV